MNAVKPAVRRAFIQLVHFLFYLEQQKNDADSRQNMPDPCDSGDRSVRSSAQFRSPHMRQPSQKKAKSGNIQTKLIDGQKPAGFLVRKRSLLFGSAVILLFISSKA